MRIYILGSNTFMQKMVAVTDELIGMGLNAHIAEHYRELVAGKKQELQDMLDAGERAKVKQQFSTFKLHYKNILESDAILIVNDEKREIGNYIGGNVLIEMGQAFVNDKKIFFLNGMPEGLSYMDEIIAINPICLEGNLEKLKEYKYN